MTLALIVDSLGFPEESHILEGNAVEPETLASMLESIREGIVHTITCERNLKGAAKLENLGHYVIRTDRIDLNEEDLSGVRRSLTTIEGSFRAMKSDLGLRPNYHKCEEATTAHIFHNGLGIKHDPLKNVYFKRKVESTARM